MALIGFDSGEATRYPTLTAIGGDAWLKTSNQPSPWELYGSNASNCFAGIVTSPVYSGSTAFKVECGGGQHCGMRRSFGSAHAETFIAFMFQTNALYGTHDLFILTDASMNVSMRLQTNSSGNILVYAGPGSGTLKATIAAAWSPNSWHSIQIHQRTSDSTLEIKLDNGTTTDCSGTAMSNWYYLILGSPISGGAGDASYYDCLTINDQSGSTNNSWPGSPKIATALRPRADTAVQDWTRNTGSNNFDMIKEASPDLDTTYLVSHAFDDVSTFDLDTLTLPDGSAISGICLTAVAERADAASLIPVISRGGSTPDLSALAKPVGADYMTPIEWFIELDPITSAPWTLANLNTTHFGFKHSN
jgi:hypothetical protein